MSDFDWKDTVGTVAPALATALGGPLAGLAVGTIAKKLGLSGDETEVIAAITRGDKDTLLKLKQAEHDFERQLKELDIRLIEAEVDDRKDARLLAIKTGRLPQLVLSVLFIGGYFGCAYIVFGGEVIIADNMREMAGALMGIMTLAINTIIKFWFGMIVESKSSHA